ncbi:hypothetical protein N5923_09140 [Erwiniaceae bacterium BAC15a-03b]|uniref:Lipoprotein n=1 Tax=Winslowiella arboricola TaxID=2978220 RepID=A0A9J6PPW2_9GAMM|nr:hypothetical protein [Winslowiella arboricola]MCU5773746.1 hypothetical protein [Winslowiella arboricola]MCU5777656.1 hypothetical protein [Winslowiella arboricola]
MVSNLHSFVICFLLALLLTGCNATDRPAVAEITLPPCVDITAVDMGALTAERHYEDMISCIKNQQFNKASFHYAIAGVKTWHDYLASPGLVSKERHQSELRKQLTRLSEQQKRLFWDELNMVLRDEKRLYELCSMIEISESNKRSKILFDKAKTGYLHCEKEIMF